MKSKIETQHVVVAEFSLSEAVYLKTLLQNALYEEDLDETSFRNSIFTGLPSFEDLDSKLKQ